MRSHRAWAQVKRPCDNFVARPLTDEAQYLGLAGGEIIFSSRALDRTIVLARLRDHADYFRIETPQSSLLSEMDCSLVGRHCRSPRAARTQCDPSHRGCENASFDWNCFPGSAAEISGSVQSLVAKGGNRCGPLESVYSFA